MGKYFKHKEKYVLNFVDIGSIKEMHQIIKKEFDFPEYYGMNWDAFWDFATDMPLEMGINIEIVGLDKNYKKFQTDIDVFLQILKRLKHSYNNAYSDIISIKIYHGQTVVEIN